jgi:hypothetical protein
LRRLSQSAFDGGIKRQRTVRCASREGNQGCERNVARDSKRAMPRGPRYGSNKVHFEPSERDQSMRAGAPSRRLSYVED